MEPRHFAIVKAIKVLSGVDLFYCEDIPHNVLAYLEEAFDESDLPITVDLVNYNKCDHDFKKRILENYMCIQATSRSQAPAFCPIDQKAG